MLELVIKFDTYFSGKCVSFSEFDCLLNKGVFMLHFSLVVVSGDRVA